jgi:hypothetical protein
VTVLVIAAAAIGAILAAVLLSVFLKTTPGRDLALAFAVSAFVLLRCCCRHDVSLVKILAVKGMTAITDSKDSAKNIAKHCVAWRTGLLSEPRR